MNEFISLDQARSATKLSFTGYMEPRNVHLRVSILPGHLDERVGLPCRAAPALAPARDVVRWSLPTSPITISATSVGRGSEVWRELLERRCVVASRVAGSPLPPAPSRNGIS